MSKVNIHEAKTNLSKLVDAVESGAEPEVILARNGRPAARIVPLSDARPARRRPIRLGVARGLFTVPDDIDRDNDEIAKLFDGKLD
jgi:prevent-host-death family protein